MVVNDDAGCLTPSGVWACIASKLAPTGGVNADADSLSPHPSHSETRPEGMGCEANAERVLASLKHQGLRRGLSGYRIAHQGAHHQRTEQGQ